MRTLIFKDELFEECNRYPNYFCSKSGLVVSIFIIGGRGTTDINKPHILKPKVDKDGYLSYLFKVGNKRVSLRGHRIIAEQFLLDFSDDLLVNHIDGIKHNNEVSNLEMVTCQENVIHAWKTGLIKVANCSKSLRIYYDKKEYYFSSKKQAILRFKNIPITYLTEISKAEHIRYERMYFENLDGVISCYSNGELTNSYKTNKEIALEFKKAPNTISYKVNNSKDLIYKQYRILFEDR